MSSARLSRMLCAAFMGVVLGCSAAPAAGASSVGSTTYQVNAQHSGYLDADTPAPPLDRRWTRRLGGRVSYPLIADGRVFVTVDDGALGTTMIYALDAATGQTLWSRTGGEPLARIAYDAGRVFAYDETGSLRALDAVSGRTEWIAGQGQRFGSSPPIAHDGVVYTVGDGDGTDGYARRESDGTLIWTAHGMSAGGVPTIGDGRIFVSGGCAGAEARDLATGRYAWYRSATPSCTQDYGPTTVLADGVLSVRAHYYTAPRGALFSAADGTQLARSDADWAPAVKGSLRLVMAAGVLRAESTGGGPALWTFTGDGKLTGPALIVGDHAYVASASGRVYALNLAFGYEEWSDDTGTPIKPYESYVGLGAGGGVLAVPAGGTLVGYATGEVEGAAPPPESDDPAPGPAAPSDIASAFQINPARDGHIDGDFLDGDLHEAWSHSVGPRVSYPLIADGRVFVIEYDSAAEGGWELRALDRVSGRSLWSQSIAKPYDGTADHMGLAYSDGRVFVVSPDSVALGFDASDGRQVWRHYLGGESSATPIAVGGTLFVTVEDRYDFSKGSLYALDAADGGTQWSRLNAVSGSASPALVGDTVYAASLCGTPAAFDRHTGATLASAQCDNGLLGEQLSVHGQRIYSGGMVHTLDGTLLDVSGPLDWRSLEPHSFAGRLALYRNGSRLQAEDVRTGLIVWEFSDRGKWMTPPIIVGDRVVSIATDGHVNVLDLATGEPRWSGDLGAYVQSSPSAAEGTLVVPAGGRLVAYTRTGADLPAARITDAPGFTAQRQSAIAFTAPGAAGFECRVDGDDWTRCESPWTTPVLDDGEHVVDVRALNDEGDAGPSTARWLTVDQAPPDTVIDSGPAARSRRTPTPTVSFHSTEEGSSHALFECHYDAAAWAACHSPGEYLASSLSDGPHSFEVRAIDRAGNKDPTPARWEWVVDSRSPSLTVSGAPQGTVSSREATIQMASDEPVTFTCQFGRRYAVVASSPCSSPTTYRDLAEGTYDLHVVARDEAGNESSADRTWTVDTTPPTARFTSTYPSGWITSNYVSIGFESGDTFQCQLDAGAWTSCKSPVNYSGLADGPHSLAVKATDSAGNEGPAVSRSWSVDAHPPVLTVEGTTGATRGPAQFSYSVSEPAQVRCRVDGEGSWACGSPIELTRADGQHTIWITARDVGGNETTVARSWTVQSAPPNVRISSGPVMQTTSPDAVFRYASAEVGATFECQLDDAPWISCPSGGQTYHGLANGLHTFRVRGSDQVGHVDEPHWMRTWTWIVAAIPAGAPLDLPLQSRTESTDAHFSFAGLASISGCQFRFDGGSWGGCGWETIISGLRVGKHSVEVRGLTRPGDSGPIAFQGEWTIVPPGSAGAVPPAEVPPPDPPPPVSEPPAVDPPPVDPPADDPPPVTEPPADGQPPVDPPADDPPPAVDPPPVDPPADHQPPASEPPAEDPPPVSEPPAEDPPPAVDPPPVDPPADHQPPASDPPADNPPPVSDPPVESGPPVVDPPAVDPRPVDPPADHQPPAADDPPTVAPPAASDPPAASAPPASDPPADDPPPVSDPPTDDQPPAADDPPAVTDPPAENPPVVTPPPHSQPPAGAPAAEPPADDPPVLAQPPDNPPADNPPDAEPPAAGGPGSGIVAPSAVFPTVTSAPSAPDLTAAARRAARVANEMGLRRLARKGTVSISLESIPAGHYTARLEVAGAKAARAEGTATGGRLILRPRLGRAARERVARMRRGTLVISLACTTGSGEHVSAHQRVKLRR